LGPCFETRMEGLEGANVLEKGVALGNLQHTPSGIVDPLRGVTAVEGIEPHSIASSTGPPSSGGAFHPTSSFEVVSQQSSEVGLLCRHQADQDEKARRSKETRKDVLRPLKRQLANIWRRPELPRHLSRSKKTDSSQPQKKTPKLKSMTFDKFTETQHFAPRRHRAPNKPDVPG
jgi:hypothetical protein